MPIFIIFQIIKLIILLSLCRLSLNEAVCGQPKEPNVDDPNIYDYKCEGGGVGKENCRWFQVGVREYKCLDCNSTDNFFYMKAVASNGTIYCRRLGITGFRNKKIIYGTNQVVTNCKELGLYEMGDQCFNTEMMYGVKNTIVIDKTEEVQCKYKFYTEIQTNSSLKYHICLDEGQDCPDKYHYYDYETRECLNNCPAERPKISIREKNNKKTYYQCTAECNVDGYDKEYTRKSFLYDSITITFCYEKCPQEAPYFYDTEKKCIQSCNKNENDFFIEGKGCVNDIAECTSYKSFFKINMKRKFKECVLMDTTDFQKSCKVKFPYDFPYTYEMEGVYGKIFCLATCQDTNTDFFNFKVTYPNESNYCEEECKSECNYCQDYFLNYDTKNCLPNCPINANYLYNNDNNCVPISKCNYLGLNNKCSYLCSPEKYIYETKIGTQDIKYCLEKCSDKGASHLNTENKCVQNCQDLEKNGSGEKCICSYLFYDDKSLGKKICLQSDKDYKYCTNDLTEYPYYINDTKQCNDKCDGILSLNELICYNSNYKCENNNQKLDTNLNKCVCKYNYYYNGKATSEKLTCLGKDDNCPDPYNLLIKETGECVKYCPFDTYIKQYNNLCLSKCPEYTGESSDQYDICVCIDKKYKDSNNQFICTNKCPEDKPLLVNDTNECVSNCQNAEEHNADYYYDRKCYSSSTTFSHSTKIKTSDYPSLKLTEIFNSYSDYIFYCDGVWIFEDDKNNYKYECQPSYKENCSIFNNEYKYFTYPNRRCVKECGNGFKFSFNNYCFSSCEGNGLGLNITNTGGNKCECKVYWKTNEKGEKECVEKDEYDNCEKNGYLLMDDTKECFKGIVCKDGTYFFNNKCYKQCPSNSKNNKIQQNCTCLFKWYFIHSNNDYKCLGEIDDCPDEHPFLIVSSNQCVDKNYPDLNKKYRFNKRLYDIECPKTTKRNETDKFTCICDNAYGYWHYLEPFTYGNKVYKMYQCGLAECPPNQSVTDDTKECWEKCKYFEYNKICYDKCPNFTEPDNNNVCHLITEYNSNNMTSFTEEITSSIYYMYKTAIFDHKVNGTLELKNFDGYTSDDLIITEFYSVNNSDKLNRIYKDNHNNKDKLSSSLTYIDISECIDHLYSLYQLPSSVDIIILKFDLVNTPNEYLINPVEYIFIRSDTGQKIDASPCMYKKVIISYPFEKNIIKLDELNSQKKRNLERYDFNIENNDLTKLKELYNIGKELNDLYGIDTFNSRDSIYTDYCSTIKINGKEVVIEDRIELLYPHYTLCENNCTYNHTDFNEKRIYCNCDLKTEFDLKRSHPPNIDINEFNISTAQNGYTNFPVLKCLAVWKDIGKIFSKNYIFYFHLIVIALEIILLIMTIIFGIRTTVDYFEKKIHSLKTQEQYFEKELEIDELDEKKPKKTYKKKKGNNQLIESYIQTTEKKLNYPPKKRDITNAKKDNKNEIQFIPDEFIFLYFKKEDKGIKKHIDKDLIPFEINENVGVLLQKIEGVDYSNIKASGPFKEEQNMLLLYSENDNDKTNRGENKNSVNEILIKDKNNNTQNKVSEKNSIKISDKNSIKTNEKNSIKVSEKLGANEEIIYKTKSKTKDTDIYLNNYIINENDDVVVYKGNRKISCCEKVRIEYRFLRKDYVFAESKYHGFWNFFLVMFSEILDKYYIVKILLLIQNYDIITLNLSIYLLHHTILINIIAMFFDIRVIKRMYRDHNYPGYGFYFGYGFLSCIIVWIIYTIFNCIITNKGNISQVSLFAFYTIPSIIGIIILLSPIFFYSI